MYRLTVQVRVDRLGPETPPPYLKCEFVGATRGSSLSQVHTTHYDASRLGQWQPLNAIVDIAACPRGHWHGPDYLLRGLAREYRDPQAQWLAKEADAAQWRNVVALSWAAAEQQFKQIEIETKGDRTTFHLGQRSVPLDWTDFMAPPIL